MTKDANTPIISFEEDDLSMDRSPNTLEGHNNQKKNTKNENSIASNIKSFFKKKSKPIDKKSNKLVAQNKKNSDKEISNKIEKSTKDEKSKPSKIKSLFSNLKLRLRKKLKNPNKENIETISQTDKEFDGHIRNEYAMEKTKGFQHEKSQEIKTNPLQLIFQKYPKLDNYKNLIVSNIQIQLYKEHKNGFRIIDAIEKIKKQLNLIDEVIETIDFEVIPTGTPLPGTPIQKLNITYEVNAPFQYAKVIYENDKISYYSIEPQLTESEIKCMETIKDAFSKMIRSETLLEECENREKKIRYLKKRFLDIIDIYKFKITEIQKDKMFHGLMKEYAGFGIIDSLMNDQYIEDITCNGPNEFIYINHRIYESIPTNIKFDNETELNNFVLKIVQSTGRHISVLQPIRDATLPDGSRINITLGREVTKKGSTFTIRRFKSSPISPVELIKYGTFDSMQMAYLWIIIENKRSLLAAGGTASGKTTTLNALCSFIRPENKIVSIEDTAELNLLHPNWTQSVTRTGFGEDGDDNGKGSSSGNIELYALLKAALRQRPEYIIVGEVRGVEAYTLFQAISLGHPCFGTIHAGSMKELLSRVESKPMDVTRSLFSNVDIVIFNSFIKMGEHHVRRVVNIIEIDEVDPTHKDLITNPVYKWKPITDSFEFSGISVMFEKIKEEYGIPIEYLMSEMHNRAKLLDGLVEKNITDYNSVVDIIRKYMRDKDARIEEIGTYEVETT